MFKDLFKFFGVPDVQDTVYLSYAYAVCKKDVDSARDFYTYNYPRIKERVQALQAVYNLADPISMELYFDSWGDYGLHEEKFLTMFDMHGHPKGKDFYYQCYEAGLANGFSEIEAIGRNWVALVR